MIKNSDGSPLKEKTIKVRIQILEEGNEIPEYQEEREITTSREGFVSFIIGENATEDFTAINWESELYLQDEIDTGEGYGAPTRMPLLKTPRSYISDRAISVLDDSISSASIIDGSILSDDLSDQSITTSKLTDSSITSNKIADSAVTNIAIASNAITTENIVDGTLKNSDISSDAAIDFSKINIPDGSLSFQKINIEDGSIAYSKLLIGENTIPFSKILLEDNEIAIEKLNITKDDINNLGIISNYNSGNNISIEGTTISLIEDINLETVTSNIIGNIYNDVSDLILDIGNSENPAVFNGNVTGNITGNLKGNQTGNTIGNILATDEITTVLDSGDGTTTALFTGNVTGNVQGNITGNTIGNLIASDGVTTILESGDGTTTAKFLGDVEGNILGNTIGDIIATDGTTTILDSGDGTTAAILTGNVKGNLTGTILNNNGRSILINGSNNDLPKYFGDVYYRESNGNETQLIDSENQVFFGTLKGTLEGSWSGNIIGVGNEVILDPKADGGALFKGKVEGSLTGDVQATDITTTNLVATDITASGSITGNLVGNVLASDAQTIIVNSGDGTETASFNGNAATATALETAINIGGVSFDGTANIDLPGVNTAGNQNTSGNAATTTITDNENENENNAIVFTPNGSLNGGNLGLESDGDLTYNPSTGTLSATAFSGILSGAVNDTTEDTNFTDSEANVTINAFSGSFLISRDEAIQIGGEKTISNSFVNTDSIIILTKGPIDGLGSTTPSELNVKNIATGKFTVDVGGVLPDVDSSFKIFFLIIN